MAFGNTSSKDLLRCELNTDSSFNILKKEKPGQDKPQKTFRLPPSSVLQRVQAFLPQMAAGKVALQNRMNQESKESVDIECIDDTEGPVIEMDLALVQNDNDSENESSDFEESSGCSDSEEMSHGIMDEVTELNIKMSKNSTKSNGKKKQLIQEIENDSASCENETTEASMSNCVVVNGS